VRNTASFLIAFVTCPDLKTARRLARVALEAKLAACANLLPSVESHYWWQGKLDNGNEVLILLKTSRRRAAALERLVLAQHPYDTPEFVLVPVAAGNNRYLDWWQDSMR
jgi:periplasmic divalent cation tolerance protein